MLRGIPAAERWRRGRGRQSAISKQSHQELQIIKHPRVYFRLMHINENRQKVLSAHWRPLAAAQLKGVLCREPEQRLLRGLFLAVVVSLKDSQKMSRILIQVKLREIATSGQHTISTSHSVNVFAPAQNGAKKASPSTRNFSSLALSHCRNS